MPRTCWMHPIAPVPLSTAVLRSSATTSLMPMLRTTIDSGLPRKTAECATSPEPEHHTGSGCAPPGGREEESQQHATTAVRKQRMERRWTCRGGQQEWPLRGERARAPGSLTLWALAHAPLKASATCPTKPDNPPLAKTLRRLRCAHGESGTSSNGWHNQQLHHRVGASRGREQMMGSQGEADQATTSYMTSCSLAKLRVPPAPRGLATHRIGVAIPAAVGVGQADEAQACPARVLCPQAAAGLTRPL